MKMIVLFSCFSLSYIILLMLIYFFKKRLRIRENIIYEFLIIINFVEIILEIILDFVGPLYLSVPSLSFFVARLYSVFLLLWISALCLYIIYVAFNMKKKTKYLNKIRSIFFLIVFICILLICYLPMDFHYGLNIAYTYGASINVIYIMSVVFSIIGVVCVLWNIKSFKDRRFFPLLTFLVLGSICSLIQYSNPELLLATGVHSFITFLMYFTIENPDMKVVEELIENRKIIERSGEEKSVFLFKVSQGLREPVNEINKQIALYKEGTAKKGTEAIMGTIQQNNQKIDYIINEILGINSFSQKAMKKVDNTYNIYSLLEDIKIRAKSYIKNDIDYSFTVVSTMPKELYGDSIKLKQVLMSIIINAIENTSNGFVHVDVNAITRYDICRVVISIEDSGSGIELNTINDILSQNLEIEDKESLKMEKLDVDLRLAYKIIKSLGGTMYIQSEVGHGTKVIITIDQYFIGSEESEMNSKIDSYVNARSSGKKVLIVNEDEEEIQKIKSFLTRKGYDVSISMFGSDCIERVKKKEKYDVILINDEMTLMSGISILKELKALKNASKKIVLLEEDKLFISKHYLKDGFDDFVDKRKLLEEIEKKI